MKMPRFLHYVFLLLAVWLPLDNALAVAVVEGCPMMSHAFAQGLAATEHPSTDGGHCMHTATHGADISQQAQSAPCEQCDNHCCALCLLLGSVSLPSQYGIAVPAFHGIVAFADLHAVRPAAPSTPLYRPPIV
ncbi:hypothetical protein [Halothiobacillus diazotrophicus]|nr:hypothetical protein [Halothiobacillus diazotrophicus]